jgi:hypothetical protein
VNAPPPSWGMLTFAIGILTQQWHIAIIGNRLFLVDGSGHVGKFPGSPALPLRSMVGGTSASADADCTP